MTIAAALSWFTTGVRFGLEPGRGASAVPTRATIIGAVTAVAVAAATIVFASSLGRVVDDGRFYGSNFDARIEFDGNVLTDDSRVGDVLALAAVVGAVPVRRGLRDHPAAVLSSE